mmetsp:Transcript_6220/g.9817  ORF Transcript_6220/g.9817 Transcript_6220/m.9817 type:complete len:475 (+) Transcript_6220:140-1564(+)|eukprot:CAMPEP_0203758562 /NCGR_PEP_ID=MMETSP0098-20131031/11406_1 /ASSEMBLY_ACC=CAM_ASM_000208 /TAXON_ID=96639 /ORGANISM=" , Strain NY0313808BC1" /LENGTH=474 /DNA_ID=CAMNT_0050651073 /DNA_START=150 /DNA_END=1574 /DNA_ORIENTATION=+
MANRHDSSVERLKFSLRCLAGQNVSVERKDGVICNGVLMLETANNVLETCELRYVKVQGREEVVSQMSIPWSDILFIFAQNAGRMIDGIQESLHGGVPRETGFKTDTDISTQGKSSAGRNLQAAGSAWLDPGTKHTDLDMSSGKDSSWDQFKTNEEKFGVKSTYDEKYYTTTLRKENLSRADIVRAEAIARDIEGQGSTNLHVREERGQDMSNDPYNGDEEARFSSVHRNPNAYQPPHKRADDEDDSQGDTSSKAQPTGKISWAARVKGPKSEDEKTPQNVSGEVPKSTPPGKKEAVVSSEKAGVRSPKPVLSEDRKKQINEMKQFSEQINTKKRGSKKDVTETRQEAPVKTKLTATAKEWKPNANAKEWKPPGAAGAQPPIAPQPVPGQFPPHQPPPMVMQGGYVPMPGYNYQVPQMQMMYSPMMPGVVGAPAMYPPYGNTPPPGQFYAQQPQTVQQQQQQQQGNPSPPKNSE